MSDIPKPEFFFKGLPEDVRFQAHNVPDSLDLARSTLYEAWFNALKLSPEYKQGTVTNDWPSERARKTFLTFGDLREVHFEQWWTEKGYRLFAEQRAFSQIVLANDLEKLSDGVPNITLVVPLNVSLKTLKNQFAVLLEKHHPYYKDFDRWKASTALVRLENRKLTSVSINLYLKVYEAWDKRSELGEDFHLYDIGEKLRLNTQLIVLRTDFPKIARDKRADMTKIVSEYLLKAKNLIAHATEGRFPCVDEHPWLRCKRRQS
jgi:hypothetical protein